MPLYPVSPNAPAGARALSPQEVAAGWSRPTMPSWLENELMLAYRSPEGTGGSYRDLVIMLATEIYRRERGAPPPTEDALVGTYLQSLPDDGSAELADGTTPTVE